MPITLFLERAQDRPALVATSAVWENALLDLPAGEMEWTGTRRRSLARLKYYWALCDKIAQALRAHGSDASKEDVDFHLRVAAGLHSFITLTPRERARLGNSAIGVRAQSIAFDKMDEEAMSAFVNRAIAYTLTELLPKIPRGYFAAEIEALITAPRTGRGEAA